jgi:hypothetical protein
MFGREYAVVIRPGSRGLVLHTLFFAHEVRMEEESPADLGMVDEKELELAKMLPVRGIEGDGRVDGPSELDRGIGIVDFTILPHFKREKYRPALDRAIEQYGLTYSLVPLKDNQAVIVEGVNRILFETSDAE